MAHRFHFFRAGGVDQVSLRNGEDLKALGELDSKLWVALAMPTTGVALDPVTLALVDRDKEGRIRKDDIVAAADWLVKVLVDAGDVLRSEPAVQLAAIKDKAIHATAKRMLLDLGKADAKAISIEDVTAVAKAQVDSKLNGDGVITAISTDDAALVRAITDVIATHGEVKDRSGKPGVDRAKLDGFFAEVDKHAAWLAAKVDVIGERTQAAADAFAAVRGKLDDYFARCALAGFDPRGGAALDGQDGALVAIGTRSLSATDEEIAKLPLGRVASPGRLTVAGTNPAWAARMAAFQRDVVAPLLGGPRDPLEPADVIAIADKLAAFDAWRAAKPETKISGLDPAWLAELATPGLREKLWKVLDADTALADEYAETDSVAKLVRFQRDFGRLLRNFVNFSDFYGAKRDGVFQTGTLYLDSRAMHLTVAVADAAKHGALAGSSDAYLVYVDIARLTEKKQVAVAVTNGDADNLFVGRNGVFYDRDGNDWDATIAKIVGNPISVREAFWSPYKKLVRVIEDNVTKRAQAAETKSMGTVEAAGTAIAGPATAAAPPPPAPPKKIDLGTVAAIGVALGGIGTLVGVLLGTLFGLGKWLPVGILAILLLISGPSMLLAWLKLRRRNLGPILDANGWAINGRAKINVTFGAALTELAKLPKGAQRSLDDPFADKKTPWKLITFLLVLLALVALWFAGKLDRYLPGTRFDSVTVLGDAAPAKALVPPAAGSGSASGSGSGSGSGSAQ